MGSAPYVVALMVTLVVLVGTGPPITICLTSLSGSTPDCGIVHKSQLAPSDIKDLLDIHNKLRRTVSHGNETRGSNGPQPPASKGIPDLRWSNDMADFAQSMANQCKFGYDKCRHAEKLSYGQIISFRTTFEKKYGSFKEIVKSWYDMVEKFNKDNIKHFVSNPPTDGYTQIVWANTTKLGCGAILYTTQPDASAQTIFYLVCNYEPRGNVKGEAIYETRSFSKDKKYARKNADRRKIHQG